jgi:hypothetical protein
MKVLKSDKFWKIIKKAKSPSARSPQRRCEYLIRMLTKKSVREILMFDKTLQHYISMADTEEMRGAARVLKGDYSEEYYYNLRAWLVLRGEKRFFVSLSNPDTMASFLKYTDDPEWPGYGKCAQIAFHKKTGKPLESLQKTGQRKWSESELPDFFPKLWKKFVRVEEVFE